MNSCLLVNDHRKLTCQQIQSKLTMANWLTLKMTVQPTTASNVATIIKITTVIIQLHAT